MSSIIGPKIALRVSRQYSGEMDIEAAMIDVGIKNERLGISARRREPVVVAAIRLLVSADYHRELLQTVQSLLEPIRAQRGCLGLHLYHEIGGEEALCLIEEWATKEDLDEHLRSNYFAVLMGAARLLLENPSELEFRLLTETAGMEVVEAIHGRARY